MSERGPFKKNETKHLICFKLNFSNNIFFCFERTCFLSHRDRKQNIFLNIKVLNYKTPNNGHEYDVADNLRFNT